MKFETIKIWIILGILGLIFIGIFWNALIIALFLSIMYNYLIVWLLAISIFFIDFLVSCSILDIYHFQKEERKGDEKCQKRMSH